jgi:protein associated with RNAse G/E
LVERRGQRIYVVYKNLDAYADINFFNSSDAGSTWSSDVVLFNGQYVGRPIYMSDNYYEPSLAVNGTGSSADNLFVAVRLITTDHVYGESYYYIKFKNSSSSGASWSSSAVTVANSGVNEASYPSITYLNGNLYIAYTNASIGKQVWLANSSGSYTTWNNTMLNPSTEGASQLYTYRLKLDKGTVTIFENQPAVIYPQNNGWWNIVKTIKSGDATAKAYYAQNSAGADPGSATTEFTDTYYNQANTSNSVYYQLTTTSNSGYTRYFFNFSGISGTDGLSNYTIYFKGYATGDTANLMYKSSSNWYNFQSLTSSDSTYTFSNTSTSSLTPYYYVVEFGTKQTNTSVGTDNTYVDSINITGAMRKMPDLALRNFTSSGLSNIQWIASEGSSLNSSILDVNAKYDYSGNCLEFVYRNGTASPYNIVYDSIGSCTSPVKQYNQTGSLSLTLLENGLKQAIFSRTKDLSFLLLEDSLKSYIANRLTSLFIILSTKVYVPVEIPPFICSMFRQIGDSNAYLCIFDNGTWKILIKLQIGNSYFYVFVDEPWEILIKGACILNALGNCY